MDDTPRMVRRPIVTASNQRRNRSGLSLSVYKPLKQQRARKKGGAAGSRTQGLWLKHTTFLSSPLPFQDIIITIGTVVSIVNAVFDHNAWTGTTCTYTVQCARHHINCVCISVHSFSFEDYRIP